MADIAGYCRYCKIMHDIAGYMQDITTTTTTTTTAAAAATTTTITTTTVRPGG